MEPNTLHKHLTEYVCCVKISAQFTELGWRHNTTIPPIQVNSYCIPPTIRLYEILCKVSHTIRTLPQCPCFETLFAFTIFPPRRRFGRHRSHNIWLIDHHLHLPAEISTQPTEWAFLLKIYSHAQLGKPTSFFSMSTAVFTWPQIVIYLSKIED